MEAIITTLPEDEINAIATIAALMYQAACEDGELHLGEAFDFFNGLLGMPQYAFDLSVQSIVGTGRGMVVGDYLYPTHHDDDIGPVAGSA